MGPGCQMLPSFIFEFYSLVNESDKKVISWLVWRRITILEPFAHIKSRVNNYIKLTLIHITICHCGMAGIHLPAKHKVRFPDRTFSDGREDGSIISVWSPETSAEHAIFILCEALPLRSEGHGGPDRPCWLHGFLNVLFWATCVKRRLRTRSGPERTLQVIIQDACMHLILITHVQYILSP